MIEVVDVLPGVDSRPEVCGLERRRMTGRRLPSIADSTALGLIPRSSNSCLAPGRGDPGDAVEVPVATELGIDHVSASCISHGVVRVEASLRIRGHKRQVARSHTHRRTNRRVTARVAPRCCSRLGGSRGVRGAAQSRARRGRHVRRWRVNGTSLRTAVLIIPVRSEVQVKRPVSPASSARWWTRRLRPTSGRPFSNTTEKFVARKASPFGSRSPCSLVAVKPGAPGRGRVVGEVALMAGTSAAPSLDRKHQALSWDATSR